MADEQVPDTSAMSGPEVVQAAVKALDQDPAFIQTPIDASDEGQTSTHADGLTDVQREDFSAMIADPDPAKTAASIEARSQTMQPEDGLPPMTPSTTTELETTTTTSTPAPEVITPTTPAPTL